MLRDPIPFFMNNSTRLIRHTFKKSERLCSNKAIGELFLQGKFRTSGCLKIVWKVNGQHTEMPVQVVITVPKRVFKKAVHRNLLKRLIREAYRKNKHVLYEYLEQKNIRMVLGFVYSNAELTDYFSIESDLVLLLQRIISDHAKGN